ncbi:MAG TPA: pyridoxal-phosphate dependent enzyme [Candidatus Paceibacterota bacterium]|nr:pyridoxal-phosphate dependent enzyme [Candidatus Paceibacterota bacterium]
MLCDPVPLEEREISFTNLNALLPTPRLVEIDIDLLPANWAAFCAKHNIKPHVAVLYENRAETGKLYPASAVAAYGVNDGEHCGSDTAIDSTSGGYALGWAEVIRFYKEREPNFPIKRFIAVVPSSLPKGKRNLLENAGVELVHAPDAVSAMARAKDLAQEEGYWYTNQYGNPNNSRGYRRIALHIAERLPNLGMVAWGVGSGGGCSGVMPVFRHCFRFPGRSHDFSRIAVVVEDCQKVGGVRDEAALEPGTNDWRGNNIDGVRIVGEDASYRISAAIWRQKERRPLDACLGGPSTGFAIEGAMLACRERALIRTLDAIRAPDGFVHVLTPSLDNRRPYRKEYEEKGVYLAESEWE